MNNNKKNASSTTSHPNDFSGLTADLSIPKPIVLMILDGFGIAKAGPYNAISQARTPHWDSFLTNYPNQAIEASGETVGLPHGQMGNSEVGHMHIGTGRRIVQDFTRINDAIASGVFYEFPAFNDLFNRQAEGAHLHIMGLLSDGGVHSHEGHVFAILNHPRLSDYKHVYIHAFLDGRDTAPQSAEIYVNRLLKHIENKPNVTLATITGRYYAMDRDNRWERVEPVYRLLMEGDSPNRFKNPTAAIEHFYEQHIYDEFIPPTFVAQDIPCISPKDTLLCFNFRADRMREWVHACTDKDFTHFKRPFLVPHAHVFTMTVYGKDIDTVPILPVIPIHESLGEICAEHGLRQLRIAETEKYPHVTFFFNGGREKPFPLEERVLIPSPKVATYDLQPEMSAYLITDALIAAIDSKKYDVIICNYANADMVGHSGSVPATIQAIETLDTCMQRVWQSVEKQNGCVLITADHGNAEMLFDETTDQVHTAHTTNQVPFVFLGHGWHLSGIPGSLIDIAPTILKLLHITQPPDMTGVSLLTE